MKKILILLVLFLCTSINPLFADDDVRFIGTEKVKEKLNSEEIVILDVRSGRGWSASEFKIPGAIRTAWNEIEKWSAELPKEKTLVLYCS
ncbi:MAG: rhodanese-like domain-containing protein [Candidatus Electrothrix sp. AR4]|nr:rhodanese-like domain-containing protein [Candidatus Electrothrix sp. AR4]